MVLPIFKVAVGDGEVDTDSLSRRGNTGDAKVGGDNSRTPGNAADVPCSRGMAPTLSIVQMVGTQRSN
jgi:hypothetical protein